MARPTPVKYKVLHPEKYSGDLNNVVSRSSWEYRFMQFCDHNVNVLAWGSEHSGTVIPYVSPVDNRVHSYYPDFLIRVRDKDGTVKNLLIEIKPFAETKPPKPPKTKTKKLNDSYRNALKTYSVNQAKWAAASSWCKLHAMDFLVFTEYELGLKTR